MTRVLLARVLFGASAALLFASGWAARLPAPASAVASRAAARPSLALFDSTLLSDLVDSVSESDPFRLSRLPIDLEYTLPGSPTQAPPQMAIRVPPPRLTAIVGGPPWRAVLEGTPGHEGGLVVESGDRLGSFTVTEVTRTSVRVRGQDSTWRLVLAP